MRAVLFCTAVSRTFGFGPPCNFALRRPWQQHTRKASTDASEAVDSRIDAPARTDGAAEDTPEEDTDAAILRALEDEVNRLVDEHEQYEATIERLSVELDAAETAQATTTRDYERAYNRYQQTKGIQDMFRASRPEPTDQPG